MITQRTLKNAVSTSGIGVHSGAKVDLTLHPADASTGIIFRRVDLKPIVEIPALTAFVGDTRLNTSLSKDGAIVSTVEHILAALAATGMDNAYIDINGPEMPVMDGSAASFIALLQEAEVSQSTAPKMFLRIKQKITVADGDKFVSLEPYDGFKVSMTIDFDHPIIRSSNQVMNVDFLQTSFIKEISHARTFGFLSEYDYLKKNNLAQGASLENTVVLDETKIVNAEGLRDADEFVKHKVLDAIGDLYLIGHNIIGAFSGHKSGHKLNHQLRQALIADVTAWELITLDDDAKLPVSFNLL